MSRQNVFGISLTVFVFVTVLFTTITSARNSLIRKPIYNKPLSISHLKTTDVERAVFQKINEYRISQGLPKLRLDENIIHQARIHSREMANGKIPFSHEGFKKRVDAISIHFTSAAENVAFNQGYSDPAEEAVVGWLNSPGHMKNIQGNYNLTGIGVAVNNKGEVYLTQIFLHSR